MDIKINPPQIKRGGSNEATVTFTETNGDVAYCMAHVERFNVKQKLTSVGNNTFKFSGKIPRIAPRGKYEAKVWGYNDDLGAGPKKKVIVTLK